VDCWISGLMSPISPQAHIQISINPFIHKSKSFAP
jgi:hypothetical protein